MFQQIGYILISFLIAYACFQGLVFLLEENQGIKIPIGEEVFISDNQGENWIVVKGGKAGEISGRNLAFDPENSKNLYLASANGIFQSLNQGKDFKCKIETDPGLISDFLISKVEGFTSFSLVFDKERELCAVSKDSKIIYLISEEARRNKVMVSYNGGKSFKPIFISEENDKVMAFASDPFSSQFLYIGTKSGMFLKSEDFGESWEKKEQYNQEVTEIAVNPHIEFQNGAENREIYIALSRVKPNPNIPAAFVETAGRVLRSRDWGESFVRIDKEISISGIGTLKNVNKIVFDPILDNRVYLATNSSLLKLTRERIEKLNIIFSSSNKDIYTFTIDPENSNILYLGVGELIYKSQNEGESWQIIEPPIRGDVKEVKINPIDTDTLLLSIEKTL